MRIITTKTKTYAILRVLTGALSFKIGDKLKGNKETKVAGCALVITSPTLQPPKIWLP